MKKKGIKKLDFPRIASGLITTLLIWLTIWLLRSLIPLPQPESGGPPLLYANQQHEDLRENFLNAINKAEKSILLVIYSLNDRFIIEALKRKSLQGLDVKVIYDPTATKKIRSALGKKVQVHLRHDKGIMHRKILVIDERVAWIGSANFTTDSLLMHGNLVLGFHHSPLSQWLTEKAKNMIDEEETVGSKDFDAGGQKMKVCFFPEDSEGVERLVQLIRTAEKSVKIAMFTWTRFDLADEVIEAQRKGIKSEVVIDRSSGKGVSAKIVKYLKKGGVPVRLSNGNGLLHHKFLYIDGKTLVNGSANWTAAAFTKNDDCFIILENLTPHQQQKLDDLWDIILAESTICK